MEILAPGNRGNMPPLSPIRSQSSNSIQVHHEVMVYSSTDSIDTFGTRNAIYRSRTRSPPPVKLQIRRPSSSRTYSSIYGEEPRLVPRRRSHTLPSRNPLYGIGPTTPRQMSREGAVTYSDREGIRTLADFLIKTPPPRTNMMAWGSDDDDSQNVKSVVRKAFGILGKNGKKKKKKKKKKGNLEYVVQLPENTVLRQTEAGVRYIAITAPYEQGIPGSLSRHASWLGLGESQDREVQPPTTAESTSIGVSDLAFGMHGSSSLPLMRSNSRLGTSDGVDHQRPRSGVNGIPAVESDEAEAAETMEDLYHQQKGRWKQNRLSSTKSEMSRHSRSYAAGSTVSWQDVRREQRYSSGTAESAATPGLSRGVSSVSTTSSIRRLSPPPRSSSLSQIPTKLQKELAEISAEQAEEAQMVSNQNLALMLTSDTMRTGASVSANSTATTIQYYAGGLVGIGEMRHGAKSRSPAPSTIIDISGERALVISRPATAPPLQARPIKTNILKRHSTTDQSNILAAATSDDTDEHSDIELSKPPPKSRQERVKVRKSRDMALQYIEIAKYFRQSSPEIYDHHQSSHENLASFSSVDFNEDSIPEDFRPIQFKEPRSIASTHSGNAPPDYKELSEQMIHESPMDSRNILAPLAMNPVTHRDEIEGRNLEIQRCTESNIQPSVKATERSRLRRNRFSVGDAAKTSSRTPSISNSLDIIHKRQSELTLAPVRTIAVFPPYTGYVQESDLSYITPAPKASSIKRSASISTTGLDNPIQIPTRPDSFYTAPSVASAGDDRIESANSYPLMLPEQLAETLLPPSAFEQPRSVSFVEREHAHKSTSSMAELEERLIRVERDNMILVGALTGIAGSVQELEKWLRAEKMNARRV